MISVGVVFESAVGDIAVDGGLLPGLCAPGRREDLETNEEIGKKRHKRNIDQ
jgi:hypothetical protein